jgi:hypothetical protein
METADDDATTTGDSQGEVFLDDDELAAALKAAATNDSSATIGATHESIGQRTARLAKRQVLRDQWFTRISTPNTDTTGVTADDFSGYWRKPPPVNQPKTNVHPNNNSLVCPLLPARPTQTVKPSDLGHSQLKDYPRHPSTIVTNNNPGQTSSSYSQPPKRPPP